MKDEKKLSPKELTADTFQRQKGTFERAYRTFVRKTKTGFEETLLELWTQLVGLNHPFWFDADGDMAKFTFANGRSFHLCTSTRRFHRPKKTGKPLSVTIVMGGFKEEYDDPEDQLIPCDAARKIDCCYFGMAEDEVDLAMFYIEQMVSRKDKKNNFTMSQETRIVSRSERR